MAQNETKLTIYTVVEVWRGIAASAKSFRRLRNAQKHLQRLRRQRNLLEDDVQLFECNLHHTPDSGAKG